MDTSDVYPDVLGDALSHSSQRLAQLGSLVTAAATMGVQRKARANAVNAARSQQELRTLQGQQRAAWQLARAGWAPAHDAKWLAQTDLLQAARVWGSAAAYADADPAAASALRKCEERLRVLHPYTMAWYDRLRSQGAGAFEAMRQSLPLFGRAPHPRPGDPAAERRGLQAPATPDYASLDPEAGRWEPDAGPRPDRQVEQRGHRIVQQLQSRAMTERGYALSPDELATALAATTTLPSDVIARLVQANDHKLVPASTERVPADDPVSIADGPSPRDGVIHSEYFVPASNDELNTDTASVPSGRTTAQLASESFPCTAADGVMAAATSRMQAGQSSPRTVTVDKLRRPGRCV